MSQGHVILSHGLESGPNATKVTRLAAIAQAAGWSSERPDYAHLRQPGDRIRLLLERCAAAGPGPLVLVGSSMGAYISAIATLHTKVLGAFLLAPPVALPDAEVFELRCQHTLLVHGWSDELIVADLVYEFARSRQLPLLMLPDNHRLSASIDVISASFHQFLQRCADT